MDVVEYFIEYFGKKALFVFDYDHKNSQKVEKNKYILKGLLANNKFQFPEKWPINNEYLERIIDNAQVPLNPKNKLDNLLLFLSENQEFEGGIIDLSKHGEIEFIVTRLYFKNYDEYWFYLSTLKDSGYINYIDTTSADGFDAMNIQITYHGLEYLIELQESGENSNYCFIAMSFSEAMNDLRDSIKTIVKSIGYEPLIIDEVHYGSDVTINDAIITNIKKSKFMIADFTEQKHGVYFEAGFALGLRKPVIYTCLEVDFKQSHFDTNHYPHIVYKDYEELQTKLINKIQAWID